MTATPTFAAPLVAAFLGAAAAFALNECQARVKERTRQLGAINNAVYGLADAEAWKYFRIASLSRVGFGILFKLFLH